MNNYIKCYESDPVRLVCVRRKGRERTESEIGRGGLTVVSHLGIKKQSHIIVGHCARNVLEIQAV